MAWHQVGAKPVSKLMMNYHLDELLQQYLVKFILFWYQIQDSFYIMTGKHFPYYWTFVRGLDWSPVDSLTKGQ